jgi:hypothetical protein
MSEKKKKHSTTTILPTHGDKYYEVYKTLPPSARITHKFISTPKTTTELISRNSAFDKFTKKAGTKRRRKNKKSRKSRKKFNFII